MKLLIKQKIISWFDSYNVYDENDNVVYVIKGKLSWGHKFIIYDTLGNELGIINEKIISFLPTFEIYKNNEKIGIIKQKWSIWKPKYSCDLGNYEVDGNIWGLQYQIKKDCNVIATINKKLFSWSDTYVIDSTEEDLFNALLIAVAIDATNCSKNSD